MLTRLGPPLVLWAEVKRVSHGGQNHQLAHNVVNLTKSQAQGEGNAYLDAVSCCRKCTLTRTLTVALSVSGLDNAGKTTIVKRVLNEDVTTVSPTLGFIIRTVDFQGLHSCNQTDILAG